MADKFKVYAENANPVNLMTDDEFASDSQVDQGAKPREVIYSAKINTALRECSLAIKGLLNVLSTTSEGEIGPNSTISEVQDYLNTALGEKINSLNAASATKLQTARKISLTGDATGEANFDGTGDATITVDVVRAANVDSLDNGDSGDNANINFTIGDKNFTKTVNNVAHASNADNATNATNATTASKLGTNAGEESQPVYFDEGVPVKCDGINVDFKLYQKLSGSGLTVYTDGPTFGSIFSILDTNPLTINTGPYDTAANKALKLVEETSQGSGVSIKKSYTGVNVGNATSPVYFDDGAPTACTTTNLTWYRRNVEVSNIEYTLYWLDIPASGGPQRVNPNSTMYLKRNSNNHMYYLNGYSGGGQSSYVLSFRDLGGTSDVSVTVPVTGNANDGQTTLIKGFRP